jgi:hypothetical protein
MADLIVSCRRAAESWTATPDLLAWARGLSPDNAVPRPPLVLEDGGLSVVVVNPCPGMPQTSQGVCLGALHTPHAGWAIAGGPAPDGTYAICRWDDRRLELLADLAASRTLWWCMTDELFVASTSQRALVCRLGGFELNDLAVSWLVASGSTGPNAWDARLRPLPPGAALTLDRGNWTASTQTRVLPRDATELSDDEHVERLRASIVSACATLDVDLGTWLLPLSGGRDSRSLLLGLLVAGRRPRCVTWGLSRTLADHEGDAAIATRLARELAVEHEFMATDAAESPVRQVLTRFLVAGEGRTDQLAGYIDGLALWRRLADRGVAGVIRADEPPLGSHVDLHSHTYVRRRMHVKLIQDYPQGHLVRDLGLVEPPRPDLYDPLPGESIPAYRDRQYAGHSLPYTLAPLTDIKAKYVEVANPLLSAVVAHAAAALPDHLRPGRVALCRAVDAMGPALPYARRSAIVGAADYQHSPEFVAELVDVLASPEAEHVCDRNGLRRVLERLGKPPGAELRLRRAAKTLVPHFVRRRVVPDPPLSLGTVELAFRLYLATRMASLLREDARALAPGRRAASAGSQQS